MALRHRALMYKTDGFPRLPLSRTSKACSTARMEKSQWNDGKLKYQAKKTEIKRANT